MSNYCYSKDKDSYSRDMRYEYYEHYWNLAMSRFEWSNLPPGLTSRIIEKQLIAYGLCGFFQDSDGVYKCLRAFGTGQFNIYNEPTQYTCYGLGYQKVLQADDLVLIRNNPRNREDTPWLEYYSEYVNDVQRTKEMRLNALKLPYIVKGSKDTEHTWRHIIKKIQEFKLYIMTIGNRLKGEDIEVLDMRTEPYLAELQDDKTASQNELLTFLGIDNSPVDKKERLVVDEVNSNNEFIQTNLQLMLEQRELAVDEINAKYGLKIQVRIRDYDTTTDSEPEGGEE